MRVMGVIQRNLNDQGLTAILAALAMHPEKAPRLSKLVMSCVSPVRRKDAHRKEPKVKRHST